MIPIDDNRALSLREKARAFRTLAARVGDAGRSALFLDMAMTWDCRADAEEAKTARNLIRRLSDLH